MKKKKDKKKFIRKNIKITNLEINDLERFEEEEIIEEKRAEKKSIEKGAISQKSGLKLKRGRILEIKTNYKCNVQIGKLQMICQLSGRLKQVNFESRSLVAVGDYVWVDFSNVDLNEAPRIEEILPRKNALSRYFEENFQRKIIIAANIDQVIIITSVHEPDLKFGLIDRYICAAEVFEIVPIICINKIDLADEIEEVRKKCEFYSENGYKIIFTSAKTGEGIDELKNVLKNKETVFSGHSGTGKSTLINLLQPGLNLKVSEISDSTRKGIHTTTNSRLIAWDFGGYLVDTPGIRTFGLNRENQTKLARLFPGFSKIYSDCKYPNCTHTHETICAVKEAVGNGSIPQKRYESYLRIYDSLS
ncbi:MAG: ribosome small subunit-dependent GTPase A [Armatimonadetes bacterium]|nr:ribosome small subunit-dependent GTPase A [Armatimonadota bacterium]